MFKSIRPQLVAIVSGLLIMALGISMSVSFYLIADDYETHIRQNNAVMAESLAENIRQFMDNAYNISSELAANPDVVSGEPARQRHALLGVSERYPFFQLLIVHEPDGDQTARTSGELTNRAERWWFKKFMADKAPYIGKSYYSVFSNTAVTTLVNGIYDHGLLTGVLMSNIEISTLQPMVERYTAGPGSYAYLLDGDGTVVVHPDRTQIVELYNYKTLKKSLLKRDSSGVALRDDKGNEITEEVDFSIPQSLKAIIDEVTAGRTGIGEYTDEDGERYVCAYRSIPLPGGSDPWNLIMVQKKSTALAFLTDAAQKNMAVVLIVLLLSLGLVYLVAGRITRPLLAVIETTRRIADGDLAAPVPQSGAGAELGVLEESVARMAKSLQKTVGELELKNSLLAAEIAEREQAQRTLAVSEEKYSKAFRYASDVIGIVRLDDETYVEVSDAFFQLLGYARAEVIGHSSKELGLWYDLRERDKAFQLAAAGAGLRNSRARWRTKAGELRNGLCSGEILQIGGVRCLLFVWHDVTDAQKAEAELRQAKTELEEKVETRTQELTAANQELLSMNETLSGALDELQQTQDELIQTGKMAALGRLVAGVAHEVNTPIGVGVTAVSYLTEATQTLRQKYRQGALSRESLEHYLGDAEQSLTILTTNLKRAAHLINSFKKVSVDQSSEQKRLFRVTEYIEEIVLTLHPKLKKTEVEVNIDGSSSIELYGHAGAFAQLLTNLLDNSLVHGYETGQSGKIEISFSIEDSVFRLLYRDDGAGMADAVREHVFDPFFTTKRGQGGTGLGMHIVYNIVTQKFNGRIECRSTIGAGTLFAISLPLSGAGGNELN